MRKREYMENQRGRDIHEQFKSKKNLEVPLEDVFFVLTRDGVDAFTNMFENSIRNVVAEEVDKAFRSVAEGMQQGLAGIISGTVSKVVKEETNSKAIQQILNDMAEYEEEYLDVDYPEEDVAVTWDVKSEDFPNTLDEDPEYEPTKHRNGWSDQEDRMVIEGMAEGELQGMTRGQTYEQLSEILGRTPGAIKYRWSKKLSKQSQ